MTRSIRSNLAVGTLAGIMGGLTFGILVVNLGILRGWCFPA